MKGAMIGIVGGYGSVGRYLAESLMEKTAHSILIGGRDAGKAEALAGELGNRAHWMRLDIEDRHSLDAFCCRCELVINCAGPSRLILDKVALAALRSNAHYIDAGGEEPLFDLLSGRLGDIREDGLSFVLSTGIYPGLSAIFPAYVADTQFDRVEDADLFFSFGGSRLSLNSAWDCVRAFNSYEKSVPCYEEGQLVSGKSQPRTVDLPGLSASAYAHPTFMEEGRRLAERYGMRNLHVYLVPGESTLRALIAVKGGTYENEEDELEAARRLSEATAEDAGSPLTVYHVVMKGESGKTPCTVHGTMRYEDDSTKLVALVLEATAELVLDGETKPGVFFLEEAVAASRLMDHLKGLVSVTIDKAG